METGTPAKTPRGKRNAPSDFIQKETLDDGRVVWVNPSNLEEIVLNPPTVPTRELLLALAANGIVPQVPTVFDEPRGTSTTIPDDVEDEEDDTPLARVLAKMTNGDPDARSEVRVYREKSDRTLTYCATFTVSEFDDGGNELIRAAFGPGRYRVRVYGPKIRDGVVVAKFVHLTNELVEIEASAIPLKAVIAGAPQTGGGEVNAVAQALMPVIQQLQAQVAAVINKDPYTEMERMAKLMALFGGNKQGGGNLMQQLREMRELMKFEDEVRDSNKGGKKDETGEPSMMGLLGEGLKLIQTTAGQQQSQPQQHPQLAGTPGHINQPEGQDVNFQENLLMNVTFNALMASAGRGDDPKAHAAGLLESMPEDAFALILNPLWFDMIKELMPTKAAAFEQNKVWLTTLRDEIVRLDKELDKED